VYSSEADFQVFPLKTSELENFLTGISSKTHLPLNDLMQGIASSPLWSSMPTSSLLVRQSPPLIAVLGNFDEVSEARLEALSFQVHFSLRTFRYVNYSKAEEDCKILASRILERFGEEGLKKCHFTAIPRGGYFILGLLAYILCLHPSQMESPIPKNATLIVVDDCAISGARFRDYLKKCENERILFAPLYSHPDLRGSITKREHRVVACVSAHDLADYSDEIEGGKEAYNERWNIRFGDDRYWIGLPEYICFAWNEPDRPFWNHVSGKIECGWTILPHEYCLKNGPPRIQIYIQPDAQGPIKPTDHVIFMMDGDSVFIGNLDSKESYHLDGVGADIWWGIIECGNRQGVMKRIQEKYEINEESLREDVDAFLRDLIGMGILEQTCEDTGIRNQGI